MNRKRLGRDGGDIYYRKEVIQLLEYHRLKCELFPPSLGDREKAAETGLVKDRLRGNIRVCHRDCSAAARDMIQELSFEAAQRYELPFKELFDSQ